MARDISQYKRHRYRAPLSHLYLKDALIVPQGNPLAMNGIAVSLIHKDCCSVEQCHGVYRPLRNALCVVMNANMHGAPVSHACCLFNSSHRAARNVLRVTKDDLLKLSYLGGIKTIT